MNEMEAIHKLLRYSFSELNLAHYISNFSVSRERDIKESKLVFHVDGPPSTKNIACNLGEWVCDQLHLKRPCDLLAGETRTKWLLKVSIAHIAISNDLPEELQRVIDGLQKKFEVFHRIFTEYDSNLHKRSDEYRDPACYALLSIILQLRFHGSGNFNDINTAVKINDLLLKSPWSALGKKCREAEIAMSLEKSFLEKMNAG